MKTREQKRTKPDGHLSELSSSLKRGLLLAFMVTIGSGMAAAGVTPPLPDLPAFPKLQLPGKMRGADGLRHLGTRAGEIAASYRWSTEKFTRILREDRHAWLDKDGRLFYADEFPPIPEEATTVVSGAATATTAPLVLADTFKLHSRPGAPKVIYLDFDGHTTTGSAWNTATITAPAYDFDGNPAVFSDAELERIQYIWRRVADDYAPLNIDVTTELPSDDALYRTSTADTTYGSRVVITHSSVNVCSGCGGVAYVGVYGFASSTRPDYYMPAWVLYDRLGAGNEKYVAEAISHEAGHNLGLSHDGTSLVGYYSGHGSGTTGWAPIMGVGYYQNTVQWSQGEYPDANNTEDDLATMQWYGPTLLTDDFGNAFTSATPIAGTTANGTTTVDQPGLIGTRTDLDVFSFTTTGGAVSLTITPEGRSPNLDVGAALYAADGTLIIGSNPVDRLDATIAADVPAGTYYLAVDGVGKAANGTDYGYSDYASLGLYRIAGTYVGDQTVVVPPKPPVAVVSANPLSGQAPLNVGFIGDGSSDPDGTIVSYQWNFGDGTTATTPNPLKTYSAAGTYNAVLTVTDSQGLSNSAGVTITVTAPPVPSPTVMHVHGISVVGTKSGTSYTCTATVTIANLQHTPTSAAKVTGSWSGAVTSKAVSANTSTAGTVSFTSAKTSAKTGTCTFTVSAVAKTGMTYDPTKNDATSGGFTW